jgi:histidine triad (HIT) family protein
MNRDAQCVFCKIVAVELPAAVVYEDDAVLAFLDINPLADCHVLIVPREHYTELSDLPSDVCSRLFSCVPKLARAVVDVTNAAGYNVLVNNGRLAGQVVPHVHVHIIPRHPTDDLGFRWNAKRYASGRAQELAGALQHALAHA